MQKWEIGEVTVTRIDEIVLPVPYHEKYPFMAAATPDALKQIPWLYPNFVSEEGHLKLAIHALLVQSPEKNILVDTCIGNDKPRKITANKALQTTFLQHLEDAGCPAEKIDSVVCTHLHVDHVGWNTRLEGDSWIPTFKNAEYLIGRVEYEHWSNSDDADQLPVMSDSIDPIFSAGLAKLVETSHKICEAVSLVPTLGHTPGHVSVEINSEGEKALITGDFMHHPCQIAQPDWTVHFDVDSAAAVKTRKEMLASLADKSTLVIGTHFAHPTAGKLVSDGKAYRLIS